MQSQQRSAPGDGGGSGYRSGLGWRIYDAVSQFVDQRLGWFKLPTPLGLLALIGVRNNLRRENLYDTTDLPATGERPLLSWDPAYLTARSPDGSWNDLDDPKMGRAGSRFGRNVPLEKANREPEQDLMSPNPRTVSRELMTRHEFQAATSLNALVSAWLQFMIRDWFNHGKGPENDVWQVPLVDSDPWPEHPMVIPKTPADPTRPAGEAGLLTYVNSESHWWDGSQLYGNSPEDQAWRRTKTDGKLRIRPDGRLDIPDDPRMSPLNVPGWWLGLSILGSLFVLEHNAICDRLKAEYPTWSDEELFQRARLINVAVLAKIHTVEWTPVVIGHPTTRIAMRANWWGLAGEKVTGTLGRISGSEVISGIPGSETNHYGVPYALTEEFTSVYRMHPLIPDDWSFRSHTDHAPLGEHPFSALTGPQTEPLLDQLGLTDVLYSFGHVHPGINRLHNFPRDLQNFVRPNGKPLDLAATDILRSRELGVPRYNEFRRLLHLPPAKSFETLTDNPQWAEEMRRVYGDDIEKVDLTVGMFAEPLPEGFAFSDTAFRIFIVMASRRLNSDRFFTRDYMPHVYTPLGMRWINDTDMTAVILRHLPQLAPALRGHENAFEAWNSPLR
jgi:hypothetical protein